MRVVAPSLMRRLSHHGLAANKIFVAENGTDLEKFHPIDRETAITRMGFDRGRRRLGLLANLTRWQGTHCAIAAMEDIAAARDDVDLMIAGDGIEMANLKRQAAAGRAAARIHFLGQVPVEQANDFLNTLDIALAPFPADRPPGSPVKLRDYCAAGCAIVASDLPQNLEQLPPDVVCFHKADNPADMARAVLALLDEPAAARDMGRRARAFAETKWAWKNTVDAVTEHLHKFAK